MALWLTAGKAIDTKGESDRPDRDLWRTLLAALEQDRPAWHISAACRDVDPRGFFPEHGQHPDIALEAKALCHTCPVEALCLADALEQPTSLVGIWGGTGGGDRKKLRSGRRASSAA